MIPLIVFLLACAVVYVGTVQAAFTALMRVSLRLLAERTDRSSSLDRYLEEPARLFVPARIVLGVLLVTAGALVAWRIGVTDARSAGLVGLLLVVIVGVSEHLVPWMIVRRHPRAVLEVLLPSFNIVVRALRPITKSADLLIRAARLRPPAAEPTEGVVLKEPSVAETESTPLLEEGEERKLLRSIVDFGDRLVREVMTPRPDIVAIRAEATLDELRAFFREQEYSRIPVYRDSLDNILGFAFVKDLIKQDGVDSTTPVTSIMRPAYFVPETKRVPELLREFQRRQVQSAVVVDEYGGTAGLVSLEDLIEELVGEIRDEYDVEAEPVVDQGDGSYVVSGRANVEAVAKNLGIEVEGEGFETVGGYLLSHIGRVPQVGETFDVNGLEVEVLEVERRRVHRVRVRRKQPVAERP